MFFVLFRTLANLLEPSYISGMTTPSQYPAPFAPTLLWNARLLMIERATEDAKACAHWYSQLLGDPVIRLAPDVWQVRGTDRWMLFRTGAKKTVPMIAFAFPTYDQWASYRTHLKLIELALHPVAPELQALFGEATFAVRDPDNRTVLFCVAPSATESNAPSLPDDDPVTITGASAPAEPRSARMQHFVCASMQTEAMLEFYRDVLGFMESDRVVDTDGDLSSAFVRSDAEHHSFAVFRAPHTGPDHHAYELPNWNAIRDWADHCGDLEIPLWWGPGRHGVGNNLFFMIEDPDGYKVEFSTELELMSPDQAYREWPHGPRALNLWGNAWMRS